MELARLVMRTQISRVTAMLSGAAKPSRAYVHVDLTMVPAIVVPLDAAEVRRMTDGRAGDEPIRQGAVAVIISTSRDGRHARDLVHMPWPLGRA